MDYKNVNIVSCLCRALLIIACVLSFSTVFFALDYTDSFFHGCNFLLSNKISVFFPFTQGLYLATNFLFGDYVIAYRIVNWLVYFGACLLVYFVLCKKDLASVLLLSMAVVAIPLTNTNVFNGNGLSALFLVGSFVSCVKFAEGHKKWIWILPVMITLGILSRFPNIVMIVMISITAPLFCRGKSLGALMCALFVSLSLFISTELVMWGGINNCIAAISRTFNSSVGGGGADHSLSFLFQGYLHTLKDMISYIKYLSVISIIPLLGFFTNRKSLHLLCAILYLCGQVVFVWLRVKLISDVLNYFLIVYLYSNICVLIYFQCILALLRKNLKMFGLMVLSLGISICAAAGSDSGLCLIGGPLFILLPWIVLQFIRTESSLSQSEIVELMVSLLMLGICSFFYVRIDTRLVGILLFVVVLTMSWFWKNNIEISLFRKSNESAFGYSLRTSIVFVFILSFVLVVTAKRNTSFHDRPLRELNSYYNIPQFKGIRTNGLSVEFFEQVMADYYTISPSEKVVFFGRNSALFGYVTGTGLINGVDFTQDDSERNLVCLRQFLVQNPIVFLCPENPGIYNTIKLKNYSNTHKMLLEEYGYSCVNKGTYAIYYPNRIKSNN